MSLSDLNKELALCNKCPRFLRWASTRKGIKKEYSDCDYWGKPVPGFGNHHGRLLIIGLAPGAHGANRTGRPFTGDVAGDYLIRALHRHGFSNKPFSKDRQDGLVLFDTYITNAVRCAPPKDLPEDTEFIACRYFLHREMKELTNVKVILVLGEKAFGQVKDVLQEQGANMKNVVFQHEAVYRLDNNYPCLVVSYHTSQRNINRKIISEEKLDKLFKKVTRELKNSSL